MSKSDLLLEQDPYLRLGYGIQAYFDIILQLLWLMLLCMLVTTPLMIKFANFDALNGQLAYAVNMFSLGNMGGATAQCSHALYKETDARLNLVCPTGVLNTAAVDEKSGIPLFQAGLINAGQTMPNQCSVEAFTDPYNCSSYVDVRAMQAFIALECDGKDNCHLQNLGQFVDESSPSFNRA